MTDTITDQYPVLVYGTLRPGQGNYRNLLEGETIAEQDVRLAGYEMRSNGGFPYLLDGDREIVATLVTIEPERYAQVLQELDWLEGYRGNSTSNHYDRRLVTFDLNGQQVQAWIYIAGARLAAEVRRELPLVESGDWVEFDLTNVWNRYYHGAR